MIILFQNILFLNIFNILFFEFLHAIAVLSYLLKLKKDLGLAFMQIFCMIFPKNVLYLILYQWPKFQCHTFFPSQDIKQNMLLSSYLDS